jgi:SOS-response transcriptional repressor LexA
MTDTIEVAGLTELQAQALRFIDQFIRERGTSPSVEDVRQAPGLRSKSSAHRQLWGLRERGRIQWSDRRKRSITIVSDKRAGHALRPDVQAALERWCLEHQEEPAAVVNDAVLIHLDKMAAISEACGGQL